MTFFRQIYLDGTPTNLLGTPRVFAGDHPVFSWALDSAPKGTCYVKASLVSKEGHLWQSPRTPWQEGQIRCLGGKTLPVNQPLFLEILLVSNRDEIIDKYDDLFYRIDIDWDAPWIDQKTQTSNKTTRYFTRKFNVRSGLAFAHLYVSGIGYHKPFLNGNPLTQNVLTPPPTAYQNRRMYEFYLLNAKELAPGKNRLGIQVGCGWRDNAIMDVIKRDQHHDIAMRGTPRLSAMLFLYYVDGTTEIIKTDKLWHCTSGPLTFNDIFDGTCYDSRKEDPSWCDPDEPYPKDSQVVLLNDAVDMVPCLLPPVREIHTLEPVDTWFIGGKRYFDFGRNIAGYAKLYVSSLPEKNGEKVTLRYSEEINENGELYTDTLRTAKAQDTFITRDPEEYDEYDPEDEWYAPSFTYHGFRYVCLESSNAESFSCNDIAAVEIRNPLDKEGSTFTCGNSTINAIFNIATNTERANIHNLLTDCPQRDERMGWMNDATVRFEAFPYAFECDAIFRKILDDMICEQNQEGAITCTAPFCYGFQPADPVCSSFLVAGMMAYLHCGDLALLKKVFPNYIAWEKCLLAHSENYIVNYTHYGDWAAPSYACEAEENPKSKVTPGILMSTGYSYYNCSLIAKMADILGDKKTKDEFKRLADSIADAIRTKWYNKENKTFATGSQGCQTFMLWLDIFPQEDAQIAADNLAKDLRDSDFHFTTGNLCTRYLFDVLTKFGHVDEAFDLITRDTYPSWGYMLQQEATTVWERFELKKDGSMNSHNHPMYAAVYYWMFAGLAGIRPTKPGYKEFEVNPAYPRKLLHTHCTVETPRGTISVRWFHRYGKLFLHVNVPAGSIAHVHFNGKITDCPAGFHVFSMDKEEFR